MLRTSHLDHLVLTVASIEKTVDFYTTVMGWEKIVFGNQRVALQFGQQKVNLHEVGKEFEPKARQVQAGSADLCFIMQSSIAEIVQHLEHLGIPIEEGPVRRTGATGPIESVYIRDPDGNLIELSRMIA